MNYFVNWAHAYGTHFGIWVTFSIACTIYNDGLPDTEELPGILKSALAVSAILSLFSSHSHVHYMTYLTQFVK